MALRYRTASSSGASGALAADRCRALRAGAPPDSGSVRPTDAVVAAIIERSAGAVCAGQAPSAVPVMIVGYHERSASTAAGVITAGGSSESSTVVGYGGAS